MDEQQNIQAPVDEADVKAPKGTFRKVVVLILILACIGGGVGAWYYFLLMPDQARQAELQMHKDFWNEFQEYHATGYGASWKCIFGGTEENQVDSNLKLETIIETAISQNEALFGKLVLGCLDADMAVLKAVKKEPPPGLVGTKKHIENLRAMKVPAAYKSTFEGIPETLEAVDASWRKMAEYFQGADERAEWDQKLTEAANKGWGMLWAKGQKGEKFGPGDLSWAWRYYKFMTCSLGKDYSELGTFKNYREMEGLIGKIAVDGECSTDEKAEAYFDRVDGCGKKFLLASTPDLKDPMFVNAIQKGYFNEQRSLAAIAGRFEGDQGIMYDGCILRARAYKKATGITNLFKALTAYTKARIDLSKKYQEMKKPLEKK